MFGTVKLKQSLGRTSIVKTLIAITLGSLVGLSPLAAMAKSRGAAQPEQLAQAAPAATGTAHAGGGGSHSRHLRSRFMPSASCGMSG
jgi:hypothetical protein